ncbi:hypothetical protein ACSSS7_000030 [Eimeria intestinalis]
MRARSRGDMCYKQLAAAGGGLARRASLSLPFSRHMHRSRRATATAATAAAAPAAAVAASTAVSAPQRCYCPSFPSRCLAELRKFNAFKWSSHLASLNITSNTSSSSNCSSCSSGSRLNGLRADGRRVRIPFDASSSSILAFAAAAAHQQQQQQQQQQQHLQQQQVRCISTKRRRYYKMRKFHKKKYKKRLMRSNKVPFVDVQKPRRTWKTLKEIQRRRKQFRRGKPGKGARMLKLKRQR